MKSLKSHRILDSSSEDEDDTPAVVDRSDKLSSDLTSLLDGLNINKGVPKVSRFNDISLGLEETSRFNLYSPNASVYNDTKSVTKSSDSKSGVKSTSKSNTELVKVEGTGVTKSSSRFAYIPPNTSFSSLSEEKRRVHALLIDRTAALYSKLKVRLSQGGFFTSNSVKAWRKQYRVEQVPETVDDVDAGVCLLACIRLLNLAASIYSTEPICALINDMCGTADFHALEESLYAQLPVSIDTSSTFSLRLDEHHEILDLAFLHILGSYGYPITASLHQLYMLILDLPWNNKVLQENSFLLPRGSVTYSDRLLVLNVVTNNYYVICPKKFQNCIRPIDDAMFTEVEPLLSLESITPGVRKYMQNLFDSCKPCNLLLLLHPEQCDLQVSDMLTMSRGNLVKLYYYQRQCVLWLYSVLQPSDSGALLGDDMGLGKTIQQSVFLHSNFLSEKYRRAVIVLPVSVLANWVKELDKWCPGAEVYVIDDKISKVKRIQMIIDQLRGKNKILQTSYGMVTHGISLLSLDPELVQLSLQSDGVKGKEKALLEELYDLLQAKVERGSPYKWDIAIFDEAHKLKNIKTQVSTCVRQMLTRRRLLLSGTPIQNNLSEMWCLTDYYSNGKLLGEFSLFRDNVIKPVELATTKDATAEQSHYGTVVSNALNKVLHATMLRRTKAMFTSMTTDILPNTHTPFTVHIDPKVGVPWSYTDNTSSATCSMQSNEQSSVSKTDLAVWVYLSPTQEKMYEKMITYAKDKGLYEASTLALPLMTYLKSLCNSPNIVKNWKITASEGFNEDEFDEEAMETMGDHEETGVDDMIDTSDILERKEALLEQGWNALHIEWVAQSGKMQLVMELQSELQDTGHRVLLFSHSNKTLDMLERMLNMCPQQYKTLRIDGSVNSRERQRRVELYNNDSNYFVFLLNTKTGGEGLNLTGADRVILFDPSWNPTVDSQAIDRAYRIGQTKHVIVYRLLTCGTVEEVMYRKQVFKQGLIDSTLAAQATNRAGYFSHKELKEVIQLYEPRYSATCDSLLSQHPMENWKLYKELAQNQYFLHRGTNEKLKPQASANLGILQEMQLSQFPDMQCFDPVSVCLGFELYGVTDHAALYSDKKDVDVDVSMQKKAKITVRTSSKLQKEKKVIEPASKAAELLHGTSHTVRGSLLKRSSKEEEEEELQERKSSKTKQTEAMIKTSKKKEVSTKKSGLVDSDEEDSRTSAVVKPKSTPIVQATVVRSDINVTKHERSEYRSTSSNASWNVKSDTSNGRNSYHLDADWNKKAIATSTDWNKKDDDVRTKVTDIKDKKDAIPIKHETTSMNSISSSSSTNHVKDSSVARNKDTTKSMTTSKFKEIDSDVDEQPVSVKKAVVPPTTATKKKKKVILDDSDDEDDAQSDQSSVIRNSINKEVIEDSEHTDYTDMTTDYTDNYDSMDIMRVSTPVVTPFVTPVVTPMVTPLRNPTSDIQGISHNNMQTSTSTSIKRELEIAAKEKTPKLAKVTSPHTPEHTSPVKLLPEAPSHASMHILASFMNPSAFSAASDKYDQLELKQLVVECKAITKSCIFSINKLYQQAEASFAKECVKRGKTGHLNRDAVLQSLLTQTTIQDALTKLYTVLKVAEKKDRYSVIQKEVEIILDSLAEVLPQTLQDPNNISRK